jgi:flagellar FliL protein
VPGVAKPARFSKRTLIIAAAALVLLLIGGGVAAYLLLGATPAAPAAAKAAEAKEGEGAAAAYVDVPAMVVNLRGSDGAARFLKLRFMLVPASPAAADAIKAKLPLVLDAYQPFLRELRPEDLAGAAAVFRIKEELVLRANAAVGAGSVKDVLIQDLIQQ